jgi:hydroxymethylpyrimidine pyrophosphatase-like HAD family hydrolase
LVQIQTARIIKEILDFLNEHKEIITALIIIAGLYLAINPEKQELALKVKTHKKVLENKNLPYNDLNNLEEGAYV